jgi:hypothetical protein
LAKFVKNLFYFYKKYKNKNYIEIKNIKNLKKMINLRILGKRRFSGKGFKNVTH